MVNGAMLTIDKRNENAAAVGNVAATLNEVYWKQVPIQEIYFFLFQGKNYVHIKLNLHLLKFYIHWRLCIVCNRLLH